MNEDVIQIGSDELTVGVENDMHEPLEIWRLPSGFRTVRTGLDQGLGQG